MGRGRRGFLDHLVVLPWPVGLAVGLLGFLAIRHGVPALLSRQEGPLTQGLVQSVPFPIFACLFLAICAMAAFASLFGAQRKRRLLNTRTGLNNIAAIGWRDFERLVGEAARRQGDAVEETGLGGADGDIYLVLRKSGKHIFVQCKQWKRERVLINEVRKMYGLLAHHGADGVRIATVGGYTPDAARFAQGKPIALVDGETPLAMVREVQAGALAQQRQRIEPILGAPTPATQSLPDFPCCGLQMEERTNSRDGSVFWGCSAYPRYSGPRWQKCPAPLAHLAGK